MERAEVDRWLTAYVDAWKSYDREEIAELFNAEATYRWHPYDEPVRGREAIVNGWLEGRDEPGTHDARYSPAVVEGQVAVATGTSGYRNADGSLDRVYDNCFLIRFDDDGRCSDFTEWYMKRPVSLDTDAWLPSAGP